jgi:hypothetical protein
MHPTMTHQGNSDYVIDLSPILLKMKLLF